MIRMIGRGQGGRRATPRAASLSHVASANPCRSASRSRRSSVRRPRSARNMSSGPAGIPSVSVLSAHPLEPFCVGGDETEQQVGVTGEVFGARLDRDVDSMLRAARRRAASPTCCPESGTRRGHARPRRSRGCPGPRKFPSRATRRRSLRCSRASACRSPRRCEGRSTRFRSPGASASCRRGSGRAHRRYRS